MKKARWSIAVIGLTLTLSACAGNQTAGELAPEVEVTTQAAAPETSNVDQSLIDAADLDPCPEGIKAPDAAIPGLPAVTLTCLDGQSILDLSTARGVPMVVNVWASWCPPCIAEMPLLEQAAEELKGQVQFLGINYQDDKEAALQLLAALDVNFPSVEDRAGDTRAPLAIPGPPVTYFVQPNGVITGRWDGQIQSREDFAVMLEEYLGITW